MRLTDRIRAAGQAFAGKRLRTSDVVTATVRPYEEHRRYYARSQFIEMMNRYGRYVKVAASRTATAVASTPLRVYRQTEGKKSAWRKGTAITAGRFKSMRASAGVYAFKALGDTEDGVEEITDPLHPLVRLLHEANGRDNGYDLLEDTQLGLGLIGNAYWAVVRNGGQPDELWPLMPQYVEILPDRSSPTMVGGYRYGRGYDIERVFPAEDVIHFRQRNPLDPYYGMGDLASCWQDADLSTRINEAATALLRNGAQPGLVISGEGIGNEETAKKMEAQMQRHQSASRWYQTLFIWRKVEVKTVEIPKGAVDFLSGPADKVREVIANCFDMPVSAMTQDASSLAATESQDQRWKQTGILPRLKRIEDQINARLVPMFEGSTAGKLFVKFDNPVKEDEAAKATITVSLFTGDVVTRNEARAAMGYEPVADGDQFKSDLAPDPVFGGFGNGGNGDGDRGGGDARGARDDGDSRGDGGGKGLLADRRARLPAGPAAEVLPGGDMGGDGDTQSGKAAGAGGAVHAAVRLILPFSKSLKTATGTDAHLILRGSERCCKDDGRVRRHRRGAAMDETLRAAVSVWMRDAGEMIAAAVENGQPLDTLTEALRASFLQATGEPIETIFGEGFDEGIERVLAVRPNLADAAVTFDIAPQRAIDFMRAYQIRLSDSVLDAASGRVNAVLQESIGAGGSIADATAALRAEFDHLSGYAAERISRTETSRAYGHGNIAGWRELPGVTKKKWLLSSAPCAMCLDLASRRPEVGLEEPFARVGEVFGGVVITYADVYTNTLHPNDSCGMTFKFEDEE